MPYARSEELRWPIERLSLNVLGEAHGYRAGLGRVDQHPHGPEEGVGQLLGPFHPVEEAGHRPEGVVNRNIREAQVLELLKYGVSYPGGEEVSR